MRVCIPVTDDRGLDSPVCGHFGSAPRFLLVEAETGQCRTIDNTNAHHAHGSCEPLAALGSEALDALIVGGIGRGALTRLAEARIAVYRSSHPTARDAVAALRQGALERVSLDDACAGHHDH